MGRGKSDRTPIRYNAIIIIETFFVDHPTGMAQMKCGVRRECTVIVLTAHRARGSESRKHVVFPATCSETCSTSADMPSNGDGGSGRKTELSAIYDPGIVS